MPLCSLVFLASCLPLRHSSFSLGCAEWPGQVVFSSGQPKRRTNIAFVPHLPPIPSIYHLVIIFWSIFATDAPPFSLSLKHTFFPRLQLKSWLFTTEKERLIFPPTALQHILSFCCSGQSQPAVAKLSFLCFFPFILLYCSCGDCPIMNLNPVKSPPHHFWSLRLLYSAFPSLHFSNYIFSWLLRRPLSQPFPYMNRRG